MTFLPRLAIHRFQHIFMFAQHTNVLSSLLTRKSSNGWLLFKPHHAQLAKRLWCLMQTPSHTAQDGFLCYLRNVSNRKRTTTNIFFHHIYLFSNMCDALYSLFPVIKEKLSTLLGKGNASCVLSSIPSFLFSITVAILHSLFRIVNFPFSTGLVPSTQLAVIALVLVSCCCYDKLIQTI